MRRWGGGAGGTDLKIRKNPKTCWAVHTKMLILFQGGEHFSPISPVEIININENNGLFGYASQNPKLGTVHKLRYDTSR